MIRGEFRGCRLCEGGQTASTSRRSHDPPALGAPCRAVWAGTDSDPDGLQGPWIWIPAKVNAHGHDSGRERPHNPADRRVSIGLQGNSAPFARCAAHPAAHWPPRVLDFTCHLSALFGGTAHVRSHPSKHTAAALTLPTRRPRKRRRQSRLLS